MSLLGPDDDYIARLRMRKLRATQQQQQQQQHFELLRALATATNLFRTHGRQLDFLMGIAATYSGVLNPTHSPNCFRFIRPCHLVLHYASLQELSKIQRGQRAVQSIAEKSIQLHRLFCAHQVSFSTGPLFCNTRLTSATFNQRSR